MKKICTNCNSIFDGQLEMDRCPNATCQVGFIVEIDDMLVDVIRSFWELEVETRYCCAGHMVGNYFNPYVMFEQVCEWSVSLSRLHDLLVEASRDGTRAKVENIVRMDGVPTLAVKGPSVERDASARELLDAQYLFISYLYDVIEKIEAILQDGSAELFDLAG